MIGKKGTILEVDVRENLTVKEFEEQYLNEKNGIAAKSTALELVGLYHLASWVEAARGGWRFHKVILESSVSRILVMAALVFAAPLPGVMLVHGPGRSLVQEYGVSEGSMARALAISTRR